MKLKRKIQLEYLITQREGMIAENKQREICGNSMAYREEDFQKVAAAIKALLNPIYDGGF